MKQHVIALMPVTCVTHVCNIHTYIHTFANTHGTPAHAAKVNYGKDGLNDAFGTRFRKLLQ